MLRLLWLQRRVRRAVRSRHTEEAAYLARAVVDACIIGLYRLHSGNSVADLSAANNSAARRVLGYLADDDLIPQSAIDTAAEELGEHGRDPNLKKWAEWLAKEKGLWIAPRLYSAYYGPLSHFFAPTNALPPTSAVPP